MWSSEKNVSSGIKNVRKRGKPVENGLTAQRKRGAVKKTTCFCDQNVTKPANAYCTIVNESGAAFLKNVF